MGSMPAARHMQPSTGRLAERRSILLSALAMLVLLAMIPACRARGGAVASRGPVRLKATEPRVDVVLGRKLVMPVTAEGAFKPGKPIAGRLDDGRKVEVGLFWIRLGSDPETPSWLAPPGRWTSTRATGMTNPAAMGSGTWAVVVELPADAMGQGLWLGKQRIALNWLPGPEVIRGKDGPVEWASPLGAAAGSGTFGRLAEPESRSPMRRWRHRLAVLGLNPSEAGRGSSAPDAFADSVIEALASQVEGRWQVALGTLWMADPSVAGAVKRRLVNTVDFGGGVIAPAWPVDDANLNVLLSDLLNTRLEPSQQVDRAMAWLEAQPGAAAWVIDDGGQRDAATGRTVAILGAANLTDRDAMGWAAAVGADASADLSPVKAWGTAQFAAVNPRETGSHTAFTMVEINVGKWAVRRPVVLDGAAAAPPGVRLEPLRREWDLRTWLEGGAPAPAEEAWVAAALLYHDATDGGGWKVFLECRSPAIGREEKVRVWLGAFGAPSAVLSVSSVGTIVNERGPRRGSVGVATVSRQGDRWNAAVPLPESSIEKDGTLRIGLERIDALGRRTSWPRPMLPWQTEPGRVAIDTSAWAGLPSGQARTR